MGLVLVLAISLSTVRCVETKPAGVQKQSCGPNKNPFIRTLLKEGVKLLGSPMKSEKCGDEWRTYGTCCDYRSLKIYQTLEHEGYQNSTHAFLDNLKTLVNSSDQNSEIIIAKINDWKEKVETYQKTHPSEPPKNTSSLQNQQVTGSRLLFSTSARPGINSGFRSNFRPVNNKPTDSQVVDLGKKLSRLSSADPTQEDLSDVRTGEALIELKEMFEELIVLSSSMEDQMAHFETSQKRCNAQLSAYTSSALCSTCSGRSQIFFRNGKALMSIANCLVVINQCKSYWSKLIQYVDEVARIQETLNIVRSISRNNKELFVGEQHDYLLKFVEKHHLRKLIASCRNSSDCSEESAKELCASLVSINGQDELKTSANMMVKAETARLSGTAIGFSPISIDLKKKKPKKGKEDHEKPGKHEKPPKHDKPPKHEKPPKHDKPAPKAKPAPQAKPAPHAKPAKKKRVLTESIIPNFSNLNSVSLTPAIQPLSTPMQPVLDGSASSFPLTSDNQVFGNVVVTSNSLPDSQSYTPGSTPMNFELKLI